MASNPLRKGMALFSGIALATIGAMSHAPVANADPADPPTPNLDLVTYPPLPDEAVESWFSNMIVPGQDITWYIDIASSPHPDGGAVAENVVVTDKIPDTFHNVRVETDPIDNFTCTVPGDPATVGPEVSCTTPSYDVGQMATIKVHATANSDATGWFENTVRITTTSAKGDWEASSRGMFVGWKSNLQVEAEALVPATAGTDVPIRVTLTNHGPDTTERHIYTGHFDVAQLSSGYVGGPIQPAEGQFPATMLDCPGSDGTSWWCVGEGLAPGESLTFESIMSVTADAAGTARLILVVGPTAGDSDTTNNKIVLEMPILQPGEVEDPAPDPEEPAPVDPEPGEPDPAPVDPEPGEPDPAPVDPEPVDPDPAPVDPEPGEPEPGDPDPAPVDPEPVDPDPAPVDPEPVNPDPAPVDPVEPPVQPAPVDPVKPPVQPGQPSKPVTPEPALPRTGATAGMLALLGAGLTLGGAGVLGSRRKFS